MTVYLGLGASVGDRVSNLRTALSRLECDELRLSRVSSLYESPHLGLCVGDSERYPPHLNCVAEFETELTAEGLMERILGVEASGGRIRGERWGPRTIDIDILLYGSCVIRSERLSIPHLGLAERAFVLIPLAEMAPDLVLPDGRGVGELCASPQIVEQVLVRVSSLF